MPKYKNYINKHTGNGDIHTIENIVKMSFGDVARREKELESQYNQIGIPSDADMQNSSNVVFVHEYTRDDGTIVRAHWRSKGVNAESKPISNDKIISNKIYDTSDENEFIGNKASVSTDTEKPLYPKNGVIKGKISNDLKNNINKLSFSDKIKEWLFTNSLTEKLLPMAAHSVIDGMHDMKKTKQNKKAIILKSIDELNNLTLKEKLKSLGVPTNTKGAFFEVDSYESKKIANAPELDIYIKNMLKNNTIPLNKENIRLSAKNLRFFDLLNNIDRQGSLQNVTVFEPQILENGKFKCKIIDYSDFKPSKYNDLKIANDWGYKMQELGLYKNYYVVYDIEKTIPKRYLKKYKIKY